MADNVERVKIIRDQSFLFENKWSGVEWGKIIFWLDAHQHKIYCTTCIFIKINKKLKSITKSIHHWAPGFLPHDSPSLNGPTYTRHRLTVFMNMNWQTKIEP